jgi:hypothetical protein
VSDEPFYTPGHKPPRGPAPRARERLFVFVRGHDRFLCELVDHGKYGIEAQFWKNEEFLMSRRFDDTAPSDLTPREQAIQWADEERKAIVADVPPVR